MNFDRLISTARGQVVFGAMTAKWDPSPQADGDQNRGVDCVLCVRNRSLPEPRGDQEQGGHDGEQDEADASRPGFDDSPMALFPHGVTLLDGDKGALGSRDGSDLEELVSGIIADVTDHFSVHWIAWIMQGGRGSVGFDSGDFEGGCRRG